MGARIYIDSKLTTNNCCALDINWLKKNNYIQHGQAIDVFTSWRSRMTKKTTQAIKVRVISDKGIKLNYERNGEEIEYYAKFTYSNCNYGGKRVWFQCPNEDCKKRVGKLFLRGKYFLCRHCHNLAYETQNMTDAFRSLEKAQKIRERLGGSPSTMDIFPFKPKRMHWKTYYKLKHESLMRENALNSYVADKWGIY